MSANERKQADVPAEQTELVCRRAGAVRRSADGGSEDLAVDVRDRIKAPSRQVPVGKEATQNIPLHYGESPSARFPDGFLGEKQIIQFLCAERVKLASRRHERHFFSSMVRGSKPPEDCQGELPLLPGRRAWGKYRPTEAERVELGSRKSSHVALLNATFKLREANPLLEWNQNLQLKIDTLRSRALSPDFSFEPVKILPVPKADGQYRAITSFSDDDKLIVTQTARYFLHQFDALFLDASLAFRLKRKGDPRSLAWERIVEFSHRYGGVPLYVAEADIAGFFDCVDHEVVWNCVRALAREGNIALDPVALKILHAYLDVYSFPRTVKAAEKDLRVGKGPGASYAWPVERLREFHDNPFSAAIGVPQGGSLSNMIVNVLLHFADVAVDQLRLAGHDLIYLRYCDDVIFLSPSEEITKRAFKVYLDQLRRLKLPVHPPLVLSAYTGSAKRKYWKTKSKAPFAWGTDIDAGQIPWIGFLGYEMRRDQFLRVRASSIRKQRQKVVGIVGQAVRLLDSVIAEKSPRSFRVGVKSFVARVRGKLIASAVGRVKMGHERNGPRPCTFAAGFQFLAHRWFPLKLFRDLDRHRERNMRRLLRRIERVPRQEVKERARKVRIPRYWGRPFSYLGRFLDRERKR